MNCPPDAPSGYHPPESANELLSRYGSGERYFRGVDLPGGSTLNGAVLAGSDFKNSWLSDIDFRSADLRNVCFDETNVKVSNFRGADLRGASFRGAALCGAVFAEAKLDDVCTEGATWYGANVTDIRVLAEPSK
ncbi:MAG: pentapeptide repeat-containing protein [Candidatus Sulfotelmatobacter sp.]